MKNTRMTVECTTYIATFEVVPHVQKSWEVGATSTFTMPCQTEADYEAAYKKQRELIKAFGFGIYFDTTRDEDSEKDVYYFTTNPGNSDAVLMSLAKKETA